MTRRGFLARCAGAAAPLVLPSGVLGLHGRAGANDRIVTGHIGLGYRGRILLERLHPGAAALCEVDLLQLQRAAPLGGARARHYRDYREVLDRNDIDAVVIATPDHWHGIQAVHACEAGKDVYLETPACKTLEEGRCLIEAARRFGCVVQVGAPGSFTQAGRSARQFVAAHAGGTVTGAVAWGEPNPVGGDPNQSGTPPTVLDWDQWLGPAPWTPYNPEIVHGNFRWMLEYGGGQVCHQGAHCFALLLSCLGAQSVEQVQVQARGTPPASGLWNCPEQFTAHYTLQPGNLTLEWRQERRPDQSAFGIELRMGTESVRVDLPDERAEVPEQVLQAADTPAWETPETVVDHWLRCVATRETPEIPLGQGVLAASLSQLANLAYTLRRSLRWEVASGQFMDDEQANRMRGTLGRGAWRL